MEKKFYDEAEVEAVRFMDDDGQINFAITVTVWQGNSFVCLRANQFFKKSRNFWNVARQMMEKAGFLVESKLADFLNHPISGITFNEERYDGETAETYLNRICPQLRTNARLVTVTV